MNAAALAAIAGAAKVRHHEGTEFLDGPDAEGQTVVK
jgi:hypothetical protein